MNLEKDIIASVEAWLQRVVLGLNLCPFAHKPMREKTIRYALSEARDEKQLMAELLAEFQRLATTPADQLETTLVIVPNFLQDFYDYNQFLTLAEWIVERNDWRGVFQIASFHPNYQFAGSEPGDVENLTNCSPFPILHLLREASVEAALAHYAEPESIPERNQVSVNGLSLTQRRKLFPYLLN